ncbi:hypothetical protein JZO70_10190 [Enterococcus sp. 669A]|uniref:Helix-turn-helix domain-containing protein n=1 Tax=Candidatus Enterococcus moelleringii TaxID=2815325 RepID=A0ABS3LA71_9ENTE|nr:hypothetical protein [Enterococcus sp. 669A]MBO1306533.1 hypothetical protein [Enterococcus sp. 669A]
MAEVKILLADDQERELKKYFYQVAVDTLQQAKKDFNLDRDLVNRTEIQEWLDVSPQFLDELLVQGLPVTLIGTKKYFFSKQEVRKWIINYNKK